MRCKSWETNWLNQTNCILLQFLLLHIWNEISFCHKFLVVPWLILNKNFIPRKLLNFDVIKHSGPKQLTPNLLASREVTCNRIFHCYMLQNYWFLFESASSKDFPVSFSESSFIVIFDNILGTYESHLLQAMLYSSKMLTLSGLISLTDFDTYFSWMKKILIV